MDWEVQLITFYEFVCKHYREQLWVYCQRFSPFVDLTFTDEEVLCIYLWGVLQKRREVKDIYDHTRRHLSAWFPQLPSYGGYVQRLNRVAGVFAPLLEILQQTCPHTGVLEHIRLMDSLPIKLAHAKDYRTKPDRRRITQAANSIQPRKRLADRSKRRPIRPN